MVANSVPPPMLARSKTNPNAPPHPVPLSRAPLLGLVRLDPLTAATERWVIIDSGAARGVHCQRCLTGSWCWPHVTSNTWQAYRAEPGARDTMNILWADRHCDVCNNPVKAALTEEKPS